MESKAQHDGASPSENPFTDSGSSPPSRDDLEACLQELRATRRALGRVPPSDPQMADINSKIAALRDQLVALDRADQAAIDAAAAAVPAEPGNLPSACVTIQSTLRDGRRGTVVERVIEIGPCEARVTTYIRRPPVFVQLRRFVARLRNIVPALPTPSPKRASRTQRRHRHTARAPGSSDTEPQPDADPEPGAPRQRFFPGTSSKLVHALQVRLQAAEVAFADGDVALARRRVQDALRDGRNF